jgi:hypothetical protein
MVKDDMKDQISLFEIIQEEKATKPARDRSAEAPEVGESGPPAATKPKAKPSSARPAAVTKKALMPVRTGRGKAKQVKQAPGPVPEGDVRLTANIREDLHLKLKIVAATRRTTIGELIEELVEHYLK